MMFEHLIESSSHGQEFRRRGSFFLFTTATYALLFVVTGVVSIYAYDTQLGEQSYEINWLPAVNLNAAETTPPAHADHPRENTNNNKSAIAQRQVAMLSTRHPEVVPTGVSATPNKNAPLPEGGRVRITGIDSDPADSGGAGPGNGDNRINLQPRQLVIDTGDPPPIAKPSPAVKRIISVSRVLNSQAISLPKPAYPIIARQAKVQGAVNVQVLIDESGKVISAKVISGHPLLIVEAQRAALQARFSPTLIGDQPVKVSGVITYNFVIQ